MFPDFKKMTYMCNKNQNIIIREKIKTIVFYYIFFQFSKENIVAENLKFKGKNFHCST